MQPGFPQVVLSGELLHTFLQHPISDFFGWLAVDDTAGMGRTGYFAGVTAGHGVLVTGDGEGVLHIGCGLLLGGMCQRCGLDDGGKSCAHSTEGYRTEKVSSLHGIELLSYLDAKVLISIYKTFTFALS